MRGMRYSYLHVGQFWEFGMRYEEIRKACPAWLGLGAAAVFGVFFATSSNAGEHDLIEQDAEKILTEMSAYLSELSSFSADFDASTDIMTADGQKIKLASSGNITLNRPGQFRIQRLSSFTEMDIVLDEELLTVYGEQINGYLQVPATTIDEAIATVRDDIGFEVPGADILSSNPLNMDSTDIVSGIHVGMTTIGGALVHHLAFRGDEVDWQIWVRDGNQPLPVKYVITSKLLAGAPEYALGITNWNTEPQIDDTTYTFVPPEGAQPITSVTIDAAGNITERSE